MLIVFALAKIMQTISTNRAKDEVNEKVYNVYNCCYVGRITYSVVCGLRPIN